VGTAHQRGETDHVAKSFDLDVDQPVVEAVHQVAGERGVPMAHIAMAWVLSKPVVTAPIVGATKPQHLADAGASVHVQITEDEVRRLEEPYTTQPAYYWW
jgi:1-deoxyxylulose-5-phosphate synthase